MAKRKTSSVEVEVRCISCRKTWWVGPSKERPWCECGGIAVPTGRARADL